MHDLIEATEERHYENFRGGKLTAEGHNDDDPQQLARKTFERTIKTEEDQMKKRFTETVKNEEERFRQWEKKVCAIKIYKWEFLLEEKRIANKLLAVNN